MTKITSALTWAACVRRRTKERGAGVNPTSSASASPNRKHFPAPVARCRPPLRGCEQLKTACLMFHRRKDKLINLEAALVNDVWQSDGWQVTEPWQQYATASFCVERLFATLQIQLLLQQGQDLYRMMEWQYKIQIKIEMNEGMK